MNEKKNLILIIEDDPILGEVFNELLITFGFGCRHARYAKDGIEFFKNNYQQIIGVILDVKIPHSSCKDIFQKLQKIDKDVNVLLTTGYGHTKEVNEILALGAKGLLRKPFRMDVLFNYIRETFV